MSRMSHWLTYEPQRIVESTESAEGDSPSAAASQTALFDDNIAASDNSDPDLDWADLDEWFTETEVKGGGKGKCTPPFVSPFKGKGYNYLFDDIDDDLDKGHGKGYKGKGKVPTPSQVFDPDYADFSSKAKARAPFLMMMMTLTSAVTKAIKEKARDPLHLRDHLRYPKAKARAHSISGFTFLILMMTLTCAITKAIKEKAKDPAAMAKAIKEN